MHFFLSTTFIFLVLNRIVHVAYSFSLNSRKSIISSSISALTYFSFSSVVCSFHEFVNLVFFLFFAFFLLCFVLFLISSCNSWWFDMTHGVDVNGWPCPSNGTCVYLMEVLSTGSVSTILDTLADVIPLEPWEPLMPLVCGTF